MDKSLINKSIIIYLLLFTLASPAVSSSLFLKKEPYNIDKVTLYKDTMNIAFLPLKGTVEEEREYLKELIKSLIKDSILSYKKYRMPRVIINSERNSFDISKDKNSSAPEGIDDSKKNNPDYNISNQGGTGFLAPKFMEEEQLKNLDIAPDKIDSAGLYKADLIISGEVNQKQDDINVYLEVYNNLYGKKYFIKENGNIKTIDKLKDSLSSEIIKSIIIDCAYLDITSTRKEAIIYIDGRYFGRTDKTNLILESGNHEILIEKENFQSKIITLILQKDETKSMEVDLDESGSASANKISIITAPQAARIYLDSNFMGYSPVVINNLMEGTYRLRVELQGYISKFQTLKIQNNKNEEIAVALEKGENSDYYFSQTSFYNNLFKGSLFGCAVGTFSFMYFGMKIEDEKAKVRGFPYADPANHTSEEDTAYNKLLKKTGGRIDRFTVYKNISLYSTIALFISAGIFYYLDVSQYDVEIAFYNPYFLIPQNYNSGCALCNQWQDIGVQFSLRF